MNFGNHYTNYTSKKRVASWALHADAHMVVQAEDTMFLALNVVVGYLSAYQEGSKRNGFLASHAWVHPYVNLKEGFGKKALDRLARKLRRSPRQTALLLESEHIFVEPEVRVEQMRKAYGYFMERGATDITDLIVCFFNAVSMVENERRYDARCAATKRSQSTQKLVQLVSKVRSLAAARNWVLMSLNPLQDLPRVVGVVSLRRAQREVWSYLVCPIE